MKNTIPLVIAVILGSAAVFGVSRMIKRDSSSDEANYIYVVAAARDITPKDDGIKESWIKRRRVEADSAPSKAIRWSEANSVINQKTLRTIARGDYILSSDVSGVELRLSGLVAEGEWAVPVTFSDPSLVKFMQPGDEIAILGAYSLKETKKKIDHSEKADVVEKQALSVIFPCVRILDIGKGDGVRRSEDGVGSAGTIVVSLNPQQASALVAAQREMELFPALRRPNDASVRRRRDVGIVSDKTFRELKQGLDVVVLPDSGSVDK